jgi:hypothetical protein
MSDSSYDPEEIRVISEATNGALLDLEAKLQRVFGAAEKAEFADRIALDIMGAYGAGERNPDALKLAAMTALKGRIALGAH